MPQTKFVTVKFGPSKWYPLDGCSTGNPFDTKADAEHYLNDKEHDGQPMWDAVVEYTVHEKPEPGKVAWYALTDLQRLVVRVHLRHEAKLSAIKYIRTTVGLDLREAKECVDYAQTQ